MVSLSSKVSQQLAGILSVFPVVGFVSLSTLWLTNQREDKLVIGIMFPMCKVKFLKY